METAKWAYATLAPPLPWNSGYAPAANVLRLVKELEHWTSS